MSLTGTHLKNELPKKGNCQPGPGYCPSQSDSDAEELAPDPKTKPKPNNSWTAIEAQPLTR